MRVALIICRSVQSDVLGCQSREGRCETQLLVGSQRPRSFTDIDTRMLEGDTCWSLSIAHGISVDDIRMLNPRIDCDLLQIDAEICVRADAIQVQI